MKQRRRTVGLRYYFTYEDIEYSDEGWVDPTWYYPLPCDLVILKVRSSFTGKICEFIGWWDGVKWEAARLRSNDEILAWKLSKDSEVGVEEDGKPKTTKRRRRIKNLPRTEVIYDE